MIRFDARAVLKWLAYVLFPVAVMAVLYFGGGALLGALS